MMMIKIPKENLKTMSLDGGSGGFRAQLIKMSQNLNFYIAPLWGPKSCRVSYIFVQ